MDFDDLKAETGCYAEPVRGITDNLPADISNTIGCEWLDKGALFLM